MSADLAPIAAQVEAGDPLRFAATMAAPADLRPALWPVYAVNLELARAPWAAREQLLAEMRLQWWIDRLAAPDLPANAPPALAALFDGPAEVRAALLGVAEARRRDCHPDSPFACAEDLWAYLEATGGGVMRAAAAALGCDGGRALVDLGAAAALGGWLAALPELDARGRPGLAPAGPRITDLAQQGLARLDRAGDALLPAAWPLRAALLPGADARAELRAARARDAAGPLAGFAGSPFLRALRRTRTGLTGML